MGLFLGSGLWFRAAKAADPKQIEDST